MEELLIKRGLVASGGGALGAWGGGTIQGLYDFYDYTYDLLIGSSTGNLLAPLSALKQMSKLKTAYTSVNQKDIFDVNPFNKKGGVNMPNLLYRALIYNNLHKMLKGEYKPNIGESNNLRDTIKKFFEQEDFYFLKNGLQKEIISVVTNLNSKSVEFKSSLDYDYEDFIDWMWASANAPVFMSLLKKEGCEYVDGGIIDHIPIQVAIDRGCDEIDVIVHRTQKFALDREYKSKNFLDLLMRVNETMHLEISRNDIAISELEAREKGVKINIYYTPYALTDNSLIFDKEIMSDWWELGYTGIKHAFSKPMSYIISKDNYIKKLV